MGFGPESSCSERIHSVQMDLEGREDWPRCQALDGTESEAKYGLRVANRKTPDKAKVSK